MQTNEAITNRRQQRAGKAGEFVIGNDLRVTRLGFGAMRITGKGIWGEPADRAEAIRVLRRAVELGINFIDTADSYGPNVSEEIIAEALHPYPAGLVIATKGGFERPGPDQWVENGKPEHLRSACEGSLRRLRLERIDLYQLHRARNVSAKLGFLPDHRRICIDQIKKGAKYNRWRLLLPRRNKFDSHIIRLQTVEPHAVRTETPDTCGYD